MPKSNDSTTIAAAITTKKAAKEAGLKTQRQLASKYLAPRRDESPIIVKGEEYFSNDQSEPLISRTNGKRKGLRIPNGVEPAHRAYGQNVGHFDVFRESDFEPMQ